MLNNCSLIFQVTTTTTTTTRAPPPPSRGRGCFRSMAKIKLENGHLVTMSELQIGDRVQTGREIISFHCKMY